MEDIIIKTVIAAIAASIVATATPALAEGKTNAEPNAAAVAPVSAATSASTDKAANPNRRYCVVDTNTGTRIPTKTCRTRDGWMALGFDPLAR